MSKRLRDRSSRYAETIGGRTGQPSELLTVGIGRTAAKDWINEFKALFGHIAPAGTTLETFPEPGLIYNVGRKLLSVVGDLNPEDNDTNKAGASIQQFLNEHYRMLPDTVDNDLTVSLSSLTAIGTALKGFSVFARIFDIPLSGINGGHSLTNEMIAVRALTGVRATESAHQGRPEYALDIGTVNRGSQQRLDEILAIVEEQISHNIGLEPLDYVQL
jgi:hypothetical protein